MSAYTTILTGILLIVFKCIRLKLTIQQKLKKKKKYRKKNPVFWEARPRKAGLG